MKENKRTVILTTIVCLIPLIIGAFLYNRLPETMVTHWGADGQPNGWMNKFAAVFLLPGGLLLVNLLVPFLIKADPKNENMDSKLKNVLFWIIPIVSLYCSGSTLMEGLGMHTSVAATAPIFVGIVFVIIGNYLPKTKQSYTVGIKLPWTLNSEENWNRTHRLGGFAWVGGGIVMIILGFLGTGGFSGWMLAVFFIMITLVVLIPCVYSYVLYRKGI